MNVCPQTPKNWDQSFYSPSANSKIQELRVGLRKGVAVFIKNGANSSNTRSLALAGVGLTVTASGSRDRCRAVMLILVLVLLLKD